MTAGVWNTRCGSPGGKAHEVMGRRHPSKHNIVMQCSYSLWPRHPARRRWNSSSAGGHDRVDGDRRGRRDTARWRGEEGAAYPPDRAGSSSYNACDFGDRPGKGLWQDVSQCRSERSETPCSKDGGDGGDVTIASSAGKAQRGGAFGQSEVVGRWPAVRMSLEEAADNTQVVACRDITRVGLQDDMCAIAEREKLARTPGAEGRGTGLWASTEIAYVQGMVSGMGRYPRCRYLPRGEGIVAADPA